MLSGKKLWARRFLGCHVISLWYPNISASKVVVKSPFPVERAYFTGMSPQGSLPTFGQASQPVEKTGPTLPLQKRENVAWCVTWLYGSMKSLAGKPPKTMGIELRVCYGTFLNREIMVFIAMLDYLRVVEATEPAAPHVPGYQRRGALGGPWESQHDFIYICSYIDIYIMGWFSSMFLRIGWFSICSTVLY